MVMREPIAIADAFLGIDSHACSAGRVVLIVGDVGGQNLGVVYFGDLLINVLNVLMGTFFPRFGCFVQFVDNARHGVTVAIAHLRVQREAAISRGMGIVVHADAGDAALATG